MIILIDNQGFEEIFTIEEEKEDWRDVQWIKLVIYTRYPFEVRQPINHCGSKAIRLKEELNQKWLMFRKDYFRGAKGILKGRLSWKHIQDDIYARERELEKQDDIIDE
jgi:hypothetical protein